MGYCSLKVAKPTEKDFDATYKLNSVLETLTDSRWFDRVDSWQDWDEDDEDYLFFKEKREEIAEEEQISPEDVDSRILVYEYIKKHFRKNPSALARIIMCAQMAIDNAFDKDLDYIDWNPEIKELIRNKEEKEQEEEK